MQITSRYNANFKVIIKMLMIACGFIELNLHSKRNPFCFSSSKKIVPFSYRAIAKVHNCSKAFAILSYNDRPQNSPKIIANKGDTILGYKVVDILDDMIIVQDDKNNEIILPLK